MGWGLFRRRPPLSESTPPEYAIISHFVAVIGEHLRLVAISQFWPPKVAQTFKRSKPPPLVKPAAEYSLNGL